MIPSIDKPQKEPFPKYPEDIGTYWWLRIQGEWEAVRIEKWTEKRLIAHTTKIRAIVIIPDLFDFEWGGRIEMPEGNV